MVCVVAAGADALITATAVTPGTTGTPAWWIKILVCANVHHAPAVFVPRIHRMVDRLLREAQWLNPVVSIVLVMPVVMALVPVPAPATHSRVRGGRADVVVLAANIGDRRVKAKHAPSAKASEATLGHSARILTRQKLRGQ